MGTCFQNRVQFSKATEKKQIVELLNEEKIQYCKRLNSLNEKIENEKKDLIQKPVDEQPKLKENIINLEKSRNILDSFIKGVDEVENELKLKEYKDIQELGKLLDSYFTHGNDENEPEINNIKGKLREWLSVNLIAK